ncbi:carboxylesterase [Colwellia sp. M166]|uniref:alpha/beta hydrolase n=1 Tax=Colwellia sp. M166 TaxID=2583805 RepID=UPI00211DBC05|nr:alpha/beta hydrolase [Colwellia sp. M166]UUO25384.1 carboxylesterase [Colwellia sp. M166]|tara:strand:+ start:6381 stop:7058 length:678 start_codon:yes stop_codon:yes gene_type:complete
MSAVPLDRITIEPSLPATACVIWLHGLGDSGAGFSPIVPELRLPTSHTVRFIFPHAPEQPVTLNQGYVMRSWYDIKSMDLHNRADMAGVLESEAKVKALIKEQNDKGIATSNIVLAGFSQGGVVSMFTGLRYPEKLAGIMALSCYLPNADGLPEQLSVANSDTNILQLHGDNDDVVPLSAGKMANKLLNEKNYPVTWKTYPMAHSVHPTEIRDIASWLVARLNIT